MRYHLRMIGTIGLLVESFLRLFRSRRRLLLENLVLRQQLATLKRRHRRARLDLVDKLFWVAVRRFWSGWKQALIVVTPETVVRWHRAGFRVYWRLISRVRKPPGRRPTPKEVRKLIFRMVAENPTWGAPRIHGELLMLGYDISERTVSRWMKRAPRDPEPAKRWLVFLRNHREAIAAMDFFTVPTVKFSVLYCFFIIGHDRRRVLLFNITKHPTSLWVVQQFREAFPFESAPRFLIFDRDGKYGGEVPTAVRSLKMSHVRTAFKSPWQNGVAERWVESCRRDLLDHVIAVNERHLKRLLSDYVRYYHEDRTHLGLEKGTPGSRIRSSAMGRILSQDRLGGLHHRYDRAA
jgi:putative transposase